jgi:hypothetical protein
LQFVLALLEGGWSQVAFAWCIIADGDVALNSMATDAQVVLLIFIYLLKNGSALFLKYLHVVDRNKRRGVRRQLWSFVGF